MKRTILTRPLDVQPLPDSTILRRRCHSGLRDFVHSSPLSERT